MPYCTAIFFAKKRRKIKFFNFKKHQEKNGIAEKLAA
jgi:hypothetical protein